MRKENALHRKDMPQSEYRFFRVRGHGVDARQTTDGHLCGRQMDYQADIEWTIRWILGGQSGRQSGGQGLPLVRNSQQISAFCGFTSFMDSLRKKLIFHYHFCG